MERKKPGRVPTEYQCIYKQTDKDLYDVRYNYDVITREGDDSHEDGKPLSMLPYTIGRHSSGCLDGFLRAGTLFS